LYYRNCINQGIRPVICPELHKVVRTNDIIEMDYDVGLIRANGSNFTLPPLPQSIQQIINSGGLLPMLQARFQAVDS
jgi:3-isopropylmalate dehydratase small subunit